MSLQAPLHTCRFGDNCNNSSRKQTTGLLPELNTADFIAHLKNSVRVLPRIPKSARIPVAGALADTISDAISKGTDESWRALFSFAYRVLAVPQSRNRKLSLATIIKSNIENSFIQFTPLPAYSPSHRHKKNAATSNPSHS